jgi:uncharacterized phage protein gp47/JayE
MAQIPLPKNPLTILRKFREEFEARTNLTNFDSDSKARAISDIVVDEVLALREESLVAFYANQVANAQGTDLDALGLARGLPRFKEQFAGVQDIESNIAFSVENGTFSDINNFSDIVITDGTIIFSDPQTNEANEVIAYVVVGNHTLPAGSAVWYVSARAQFVGSKSNVGSQVLNQHNFTNYTDSALNGLKVINYYPILNGRDEEKDDVYRFRLAQYYQSLLQNNNAKILLKSLEVPGVLNAQPISGYYGIGTVGVIVSGAEGQSNTRLIEGVQGRLQKIQGPGLRMHAVAGTEVAFDLELQIKPSRAISIAEQNSIRNLITKICLDFFRKRSTVSTIDLNHLALKIQEGTGRIVSLGSLGSDSLFKRVYIRISPAGTGLAEREVLLTSTYSLASDEFPTLGLPLNIEFI